MKWHKYEDDDCITYPNREGYYWVAYESYWRFDEKGNPIKETNYVDIAYWEGCEWWIGEECITNGVWAWKPPRFKRPLLPKRGEVK